MCSIRAAVCRLLVFLWPLFALGASPLRAETPVYLELVLAVDASSSVSREEFSLQMHGLAQAFRHPAVQAALEQAGQQGIAVSVLQWSGDGDQARAIPWVQVNDAASALAFADVLDKTPRLVQGGATAIGSALDNALHWLLDNEFRGQRMVIDVSGDGRNNQGGSPAFSRARAIKAGVTINGLAILNEEPRLARYYVAGVIGGSNSFMLTAEDFEDFERAIQKKLLFEITGPPIASLAPESGIIAGSPAFGP